MPSHRGGYIRGRAYMAIIDWGYWRTEKQFKTITGAAHFIRKTADNGVRWAIYHRGIAISHGKAPYRNPYRVSASVGRSMIFSITPPEY